MSLVNYDNELEVARLLGEIQFEVSRADRIFWGRDDDLVMT